MILHLQIAAGAIPPTGHGASYWCAKGHQTRRWWSTDVTAPELWECRCGLPAGRDRAHPPEPRTWRPFKSPLAHLLERRSEAECEALLDEALQRLRVRRGRGHPAAAHVEPRS
jgi:RNA polymerase-binding protein